MINLGANPLNRSLLVITKCPLMDLNSLEWVYSTCLTRVGFFSTGSSSSFMSVTTATFEGGEALGWCFGDVVREGDVTKDVQTVTPALVCGDPSGTAIVIRSLFCPATKSQFEQHVWQPIQFKHFSASLTVPVPCHGTVHRHLINLHGNQKTLVACLTEPFVKLCKYWSRS